MNTVDKKVSMESNQSSHEPNNKVPLWRFFSNDQQRRRGRLPADDINEENIVKTSDGTTENLVSNDKNTSLIQLHSNKNNKNMTTPSVSSIGKSKSITMNSTDNDQPILKSYANDEFDMMANPIVLQSSQPQLELNSISINNTNSCATVQTHHQQQMTCEAEKDTNKNNKNMNLLSRTAFFFQERRINAKSKFHEEILTKKDIELLEMDIIDKNVKDFDTMNVRSSKVNENSKNVDEDTNIKNIRNSVDHVISSASNVVFAPEIITQAIEPEDGREGKGFYRKIAPLEEVDDSTTLTKNTVVPTTNENAMEDFNKTTFEKMNVSDGSISRRWVELIKKIGAAIIAPELYMDDLLQECEDSQGRYQTIEVESRNTR